MVTRTPDGISSDARRRLREAPWVCLRAGVESRQIQADGHSVTERRWFCQDCRGQISQDFMVVADLWEQVCPDGGVICFSCFEARLGQQIRPTDLKPDLPTNSTLLILLRRLETFTGDAGHTDDSE